jgi:hypothetical protein
MDAQRGQLYYAEYQIVDARPRLVVRPGLYFPADLERRLRRRHLYVVGDSGVRSSLYGARSEKAPAARFIEIEPFLAGGIGRLALRRKRSWKTGESLRCDPLYIRPPDAIRRNQRQSR